MTQPEIVLLIIAGLLATVLGWHIEYLRDKIKRLATEFEEWKDNARSWNNHRQKIIDEWREAYERAIKDRNDRLYPILKDCPRCSRKIK